jgi:RHS repeat-associated protein
VLAWRGTIDAFGAATLERARMACPWRLPGHYDDGGETGLAYARHRYFSPALGRYISPNPLGLLGGTDPYRYVDDPVTETDPTGLLDAACWAELATGRDSRPGRHNGRLPGAWVPRAEFLRRRAAPDAAVFARVAHDETAVRFARAADVRAWVPSAVDLVPPEFREFREFRATGATTWDGIPG